MAAAPAFFATTIFASAALVFLVEPMVAKLVLPLLGGGPSIWNTSLAFFQAALLAGYFYANALQRLPTVRAQVIVHCAVLVVSALALPLRVNEALGAPSSEHPALWLLGVLTVSIGAPFAALSATAPLVQAWYARVMHLGEGEGPYWLYSASNLGSLIALVAYPVIVEPTLPVHAQTLGWSLGYGAFILLLAGLGFTAARSPELGPARIEAAEPAATVTNRDRLTWLALAAIPSSLMLGVTTHITTDVASAPFLWVAPLALYLLTFIIAFQRRPLINPHTALIIQAAAAAACAALLPFRATQIALLLPVHLVAFFFTALICHQAMVARRPHPSRLTEFYLWMSVGGVVGGGFNAFIAPVIFSNTWEYPLVMVLACFARPWGSGRFEMWRWPVFLAGVAAAAAIPFLGSVNSPDLVVKAALATAIVAAFLLRNRALMFAAMLLMTMIASMALGGKLEKGVTQRSFFGVVRISDWTVPGLGGPVKMIAHGSTLHGAQAQIPARKCQPLVYYAPETPIGQVFRSVGERVHPMRVGAVGLGAGTVAAYNRAGDRLTFFEIDPLVIKISNDPRNFSYTTECAKGQVDFILGDARLTVAKQPDQAFDLLLIDAFSSDAVPAHLLTVEAVRNYLAKLKPQGVLVLHLSNRNLDLIAPAMAVAHAAGGTALFQHYVPPPGTPFLAQSAEDALIVVKDPAALAPFRANPHWGPADPTRVPPWTDDYTNLPGALYRRLKARWTSGG